MKYLRLFETVAEFNAAKDSLEKPVLTYIEETNTVGIIKEEELATMVYGTKRPDVFPFIDINEYYIYDSEIEIDGNIYYKWEKVGTDTEYNDGFFYILTDTRDFSNVDFQHPMEICGSITDDNIELNDPYPQFTIYYGGVTPPTKIIDIPYHDTSKLNSNGVTYVDLGLPSGTLWATCNIGASDETEYGKYFQWGDTVGYYDERHSTWSTAPFNNGSKDYDEAYFASVKDTVCPNGVLASQYDAAHSNLGGDWHMPNNLLFAELFIATDNEWVNNYQNSGVNGRLFTSKVNGNTLFIPAAGYCDSSSFDDVGSYGDVWSSSLSTSDPRNAYNLGFGSGSIGRSSNDRYYGFSVRGVLY